MDKSILYPFIAQGTLVFSVLFLLAYRRFSAIAARQSDPEYFKLFSGTGEPANVTAAQRSLLNQFEMPVLFFAVCLAAAVFGRADTIMVNSAWGFVALRALHALVHVTKNDVRIRFTIFALSNFILLFMWVWLAL